MALTMYFFFTERIQRKDIYKDICKFSKTREPTALISSVQTKDRKQCHTHKKILKEQQQEDEQKGSEDACLDEYVVTKHTNNRKKRTRE